MLKLKSLKPVPPLEVSISYIHDITIIIIIIDIIIYNK